MLASDSDEDAVNESTTSYILRNVRPDITNMLDVEQSGIYSPLKSFRFDKDETSHFKFPTVKPPAKQFSSARKENGRLPGTMPERQPHDSAKLFEHDKQHSSIARPTERKAPSKSVAFNPSSSPPKVLDRSDDLSDFDCDIPSELYSVVEGRKVFRLFNHIEHVKENGLSAKKPMIGSLADERLVHNGTDKDQPKSFLESYSKFSLSSKENFRANTLPDESRFCNFLSQSRFDTLIDEPIEEDEYKTLIESNNRINSHLNNHLSNVDAGRTMSKANSSYSNHPKERSIFDGSPNENSNYLNEIYNSKTQNRSDRVRSISEVSKRDAPVNNDASRYLSSYMSIDHTKQTEHSKSNLIDSAVEDARDASKSRRSSIHASINLTRNQSNTLTSHLTTPAKQSVSKSNVAPSVNLKSTNLSKRSSYHEPGTMTKLNEESLDVFRDFSENMAKLNETEPSYMKIRGPANESMGPPNLDDELSVNISPIKAPNNLHKENFFKTPFKMPSIRATSQRDPDESRVEPTDQPDGLANEFINKHKLQSTFVDGERANTSSSRRARLNEELIKQDLEKELQKLKLRKEQPVHSKEQSDLTRRMELARQQLNNSLNHTSRTSDLLEKTRNKIEQYKRQQLERSKSESKSNGHDTSLLNILGASKSSLNRQQSNANPQNTYTKHASAAKNRTVDQSELDNDKFRLIEEQLRQAEQSTVRNQSSTNHRFLSSQSLQSLQDRSVGSLSRSAKSTSSVSRADDLLTSSDASNDRTLTGHQTTLNGHQTTLNGHQTSYSYSYSVGNQTFSLHNLNLEQQKTHLEFLNNQLIKVKDLEDKSELIKRRASKKQRAPVASALSRAVSANHLSSDQRSKPSLNRASSDKQLSGTHDKATSPPRATSSTETSDSLRTLSLNTISPSSIDLSEQNLDSILEDSDEFDSAETDDPKRRSSNNGDELRTARSNNNEVPKNGEESSFHCKCCQRNRSVLMNDIETQTTLPVNPNYLTKFSNLTSKETEQYGQFSRQLDQIMLNNNQPSNQSDSSNQPDATNHPEHSTAPVSQQLNRPQINRKQTFNKLDLLIKPQANDTFSRPKSDKPRVLERQDASGKRDMSKREASRRDASGKRVLDTIYDEDNREELENSLTVNNHNVSLNEIFKSKCPAMYSNIQARRDSIQKKVLSRKELEEMRRAEAEKASKQKKKDLNRPSSLANRSLTRDLRIRARN